MMNEKKLNFFIQPIANVKNLLYLCNKETRTNNINTMEYTINTKIAVRTNRTNALEALTADIRRYNTMSTEEEIEAFESLANATTESERNAIKAKIANANLRFVLSVAKKYATDGDTVAELVSLGTIGLYRAIDCFDLSKGFKFISHAVHWIRAEFSEYFRGDANFVRRSNNAKIGSKDIRITEKYLQTEMREPTEEELIDALASEYGIEVKNRIDVVRVKAKFISDTVSADDDCTAEENGEFAVATATHNEYEDEIEKEAQKALVSKIMRVLTAKERDIVSRYYGIDCEEETAEKIAERYDCTAERIRQIVSNEIPKKIRRAMKVA